MAIRAQAEPEQIEQVDETDDYAVKRVTIGIIPKAWQELLNLMSRTKFNRTDVINRAISIYFMVDEQLRSGNELVFRDPKTKKEKIIEII